jgi:hypothetical protein
LYGGGGGALVQAESPHVKQDAISRIRSVIFMGPLNPISISDASAFAL